MRVYEDEYLPPTHDGRGVQPLALRRHKSVAKRSCFLILASVGLMLTAIVAMVVAVLPTLERFFLWYEVRYTILAFGITTFFSGVLMLLVICIPRAMPVFMLYIAASLSSVAACGTLCYFFIERDFARMGASWEDAFREGNYDTLCDFERTIKCQGWVLPCREGGVKIAAAAAAAAAATPAATLVAEAAPTIAGGEDTVIALDVVDGRALALAGVGAGTNVTVPTTEATTEATSFTYPPTTTGAAAFCPTCPYGDVDPSWPSCASKFDDDVKQYAPVPVTFSVLVAITLAIGGVISTQVRNKSNARRRGALLADTTESYL